MKRTRIVPVRLAGGKYLTVANYARKHKVTPTAVILRIQRNKLDEVAVRVGPRAFLIKVA